MQNNTPVGDVNIENGHATLVFKRFLAHSPAEVWEALADPKEFGAWYNAAVEIEPKQGGTFTVHSGPFHWTGAITIWDPEHTFKYEHNHVPCPEMPTGAHTIVTWTLTPKDDGTELVFTQSGLTSTAGFAPGTHVVLDRFVAHVDHQEMPDFNDRYSEVESSYPTWSAEQ